MDARLGFNAGGVEPPRTSRCPAPILEEQVDIHKQNRNGGIVFTGQVEFTYRVEGLEERLPRGGKIAQPGLVNIEDPDL